MRTFKVKLNEIDKVKKFCNICSKEDGLDIVAVHGKFRIDAKSILGLFSLDTTTPIDIEVSLNESLSDKNIDLDVVVDVLIEELGDIVVLYKVLAQSIKFLISPLESNNISHVANLVK